MADETSDTPDTPETPDASGPAKKKSNLVPILIVVGVIVLIIIGLGVWKLTSKDDSTTRSGPLPIKIAKNLYAAWQAGDQTAAAKDATPSAVTAIFAIPAADGDGLTFGACTKTTANPLPKTCTFSRPGGQLTMTVNRVNGKKVVTAVKLGPAATTPTSPTG
jgi:hypothetical protein